MMKQFAAALLALLPFATLAHDTPVVGTSDAVGVGRSVNPAGPRIEWSLKSAGDDKVLVRAVMTHRGTGETLATPSMVIREGQWGTLTVDGKPNEYTMKIGVSPDGQAVAFVVETLLASGQVDTQSGTLLRRIRVSGAPATAVSGFRDSDGVAD